MHSSHTIRAYAFSAVRVYKNLLLILFSYSRKVVWIVCNTKKMAKKIVQLKWKKYVKKPIELFENSTMHGLKHIGRRHRPLMERWITECTFQSTLICVMSIIQHSGYYGYLYLDLEFAFPFIWALEFWTNFTILQ